MGDTKHNGSHQCGSQTRGAESGGEQGRLQELEGGSASVANHLRRGLQDTSNKQRYNGTDNHAGIGTRPTESSRRQTQQSLGGDSDGPAGGLGYAELSDADSAMRGDNIGTVDGAMADTICGWGQQTWGECGYREVDQDTRPEEIRRNQQATLSDNESDDGGGYAELCVSCDNRTDELRLLGNGVVPATAERAFRTLLAELIP
jgi:hypothetical protein